MTETLSKLSKLTISIEAFSTLLHQHRGQFVDSPELFEQLMSAFLERIQFDDFDAAYLRVACLGEFFPELRDKFLLEKVMHLDWSHLFTNKSAYKKCLMLIDALVQQCTSVDVLNAPLTRNQTLPYRQAIHSLYTERNCRNAATGTCDNPNDSLCRKSNHWLKTFSVALTDPSVSLEKFVFLVCERKSDAPIDVSGGDMLLTAIEAVGGVDACTQRKIEWIARAFSSSWKHLLLHVAQTITGSCSNAPEGSLIAVTLNLTFIQIMLQIEVDHDLLLDVLRDIRFGDKTHDETLCVTDECDDCLDRFEALETMLKTRMRAIEEKNSAVPDNCLRENHQNNIKTALTSSRYDYRDKEGDNDFDEEAKE